LKEKKTRMNITSHWGMLCLLKAKYKRRSKAISSLKRQNE